MQKILGIVVLVIVAVILSYVFFIYPAMTPHTGGPSVVVASYTCNEGKTISATFHNDTATPAVTPGEPPKPGGSVMLALSDGRTMTLEQTISADGVRYSNGDPMVQGDETFVFWSKGNTALVLENNVEKSYINCVETK